MVEYAIEVPNFREAWEFRQGTMPRLREISQALQALQENQKQEEAAPLIQEVQKIQSSSNAKYDEAVDALLARMGAGGWRFVNIVSVYFEDESHVDVFVFAKNGFALEEGPLECRRVDPELLHQEVKKLEEQSAPALENIAQIPGITDEQFAEAAAEERIKVAKEAMANFLTAQEGWVFVRFLYTAFVFTRNTERA